MMNKTAIEWVKNPDGSPGYTWNPITGCLNHVDGLCKGGNFPCYAYRLANTRLREKYLANTNVAKPDTEKPRTKLETLEIIGQLINNPFYPRFWTERIGQLYWDNASYHKLKRCKSRGIFVCDMSDLFGIGVPEEWTRKVLKEIENKAFWETGDRFYLLTKQPQNLPKFSPFPENAWVGVTVCNENMLGIAALALANLTAKVKFISFEPLLGSIDLSKIILQKVADWVIIGALTLSLKEYQNTDFALRRGLKLRRYGNKWTVQPKIEWVEEIESACNKAGIAVFEKNNLNPLLDYNLRQEIPR